MSRTPAIAAVASLLLAILAGAVAVGCAADPRQGYTAMSLHPTDVATIAVPIFENDTFDREIEFELADALVKEIEQRTQYKVTERIRADTILSGRIRAVSRDPLARSRLTGLSEEVLLSVTIDFQWTDLRTNRPLVERRSFTAQGLFLPSRPHAEPIELGRFAAVQQLARDIVNEMQAAW